MNKSIIIASSLLCSAICIAEESKKTLEAEAELGYLTTTGNTESSTLNAKLKLKKDAENWLHTFNFDSLFKEDATGDQGKQTTAEKYFASLDSKYKLNEKDSSLFIFASYTDDRFSGFEYQGTLALGYADAIFRNDNSYLTYSVGPGVSFNKLEDDDETGEEGEKSEDAVLHLAAEYQCKISETAKFTQTVSSDIVGDEEENTKTKAVSSISANLNNSLALKVSYTIDYNSRVADDKVHMDTQTSVTIVYSF